MVPNTALGLALAAASLLVRGRQQDRETGWRRLAARTGGALVGLLGLLTLTEYLTGQDAGIDRLLFSSSLRDWQGAFPGRPSHYTAVALALLGGGLLGLNSSGAWGRWSQIATVAAAQVAGLALIGHIVRYDIFYRTSTTAGMALHTGVALMLLSVATLAAKPREGLAELLGSHGAGGVAARRLLPLPLLLTLVLSGLGLAGARAGLYDRFVGIWLLQISNLVVFSVLIWFTAQRIYAMDQERERAEQCLRDRAALLESLNQELDAFSYSVSHDLRAPLRAVAGFCNVLQEDFAPQLSSEARQCVQRISSGAERMGRLLDDLLRFSRLSRQPLSKRPVGVGAMVQEVIAGLEGEWAGRGVEFVVGELPDCAADPGLLRQVFVNLLSNAVKFTRDRETARIEVGAERNGSGLVYWVKDNGCGFDMAYADKLFGVFQRLHGAERYEGTGAGLAIVRRIVERHGGRVWAESEPDKGATFYFLLAADG